MQIAFSNSVANAIAFFDLSGNEMLRIDEFLFGVEFFTNGNRLKDTLILFQELDLNKDGMLDEQELEQIMTYQLNKGLVATAMDGSPVRNELPNEHEMGNYIQGGYGTYNKRPWQHSEMLQLPQFAGSIRNKLEMRRRGKEVGQEPREVFMQQFEAT